MKGVGGKSQDYKFMYEFRTKSCLKKGCKKSRVCFHAHNRALRRRVPKLAKGKEGVFNYIPVECPHYKKSKKCKMGNECHLAHGWLEVIFHPLLYKTKMCKSSLKNGLCANYGIFCAKAHNINGVRNLVTIYGQNWKQHYDISKRPLSHSVQKSTAIQGENMQQDRKANVGPKKLTGAGCSIKSQQTDVGGCTLSSSTNNSRSESSEEYPEFHNFLQQNELIIVGGSPLFGPTESLSTQSSDDCSEMCEFLKQNHLSYSKCDEVSKAGDYVDLYKDIPQVEFSFFNNFFPYASSPLSLSEEFSGMSLSQTTNSSSEPKVDNKVYA